MALEFTPQFDGERAARWLDKAQAAFERGTADPIIRDAMVRSGARYLAFVRRRYLGAARGDGTWPDLSVATKWARLRRTVRTYKRELKASKEEAARKAIEKKLTAGERRLGKVLTATGKATHKEQVASEVSGRKFEILRDTGTLFNSLTQGAPGNVQILEPYGIRVGTAINYARHHQDPALPGRPPKREMLVHPDRNTEEAIERELATAIQKVWNGG